MPGELLNAVVRANPCAERAVPAGPGTPRASKCVSLDSPMRVPSKRPGPVVTRRGALELLAVAGATVSTGCSRNESRALPEPPAPTTADPVLGLTRLTMPWQTRDPFLFCVHHDDRYPAANEKMGPAASLEGREMGQDFAGKDGWRMYHGRSVPGFPRHPHRGFETVTVVRRGLLDHADSMGAGARYGGGDVQWLTAGSGIQHAEMFPLLERASPNPVELFQIWLNLPAASKMVKPHFAMFWRDAIPARITHDAAGRPTTVTTVAGAYGPAALPAPPPDSWASRPESDLAIWTIKMAPEAEWTLPPANAGTNRTLYFFAGSRLRIGGRGIPAAHQVDLAPDVAVTLANGPHESELLLLQGRAIGEPIARRGPFVMNTEAEIRQAFEDFRQTGFGAWPWDADDPVHGRDPARFARHADGRVERAG